MATYLLDTTVIIDAINEKRDRRLLLRQLVTEGHILACCPITDRLRNRNMFLRPDGMVGRPAVSCQNQVNTVSPAG